MRLFLVGLSVLSLAACGGDLLPGGASVTDSAGVRMVTSDAPRWQDGGGWQLSGDPVLEIRNREGAPALSQVQAAVRMSDGRIALIDGGTQQLRIHDGSGNFLSAAGGLGTAPGQSRNLGGLARMRGDSLFAWDFLGARGLIYDERGTFVRNIVPVMGASEYQAARLVEPLPDGGFIGSATLPPRQLGALGRNGFWEAYLRFDASGVLVDTIGEYQMARCPGRQLDCAAGPIGPIGLVGLADDRVYYGFSETYDIRAYGLDGALQQVIRRQVEPVHVPASFFDTLRAQWSAALRPDQQASLDRFMRDGDFGTIMPLFRSLHTDAKGNLWVGEVNEPFQLHLVFRSDIARLHGPSDPAYSVFNPKGELLGTVHVPRGFRIYEIGDDYVIGEMVDESGAEVVRQYALKK
ncbi:MAG TPA: hypothetical protein VF035_07340 [Longimicrobiales bacterium]